MKYLSIIFIIFFSIKGLAKDNHKLPGSHEINFKRSKKIWGIYEKVGEKISRGSGRYKKTKKFKSPQGKLMLKDGQVVFVNPLQDGIETKFIVKKMPYKKVSKNRYVIDHKGHEVELEKMIRSSKSIASNTDIKIQKMECFKGPGRLNCKTKFQLEN